jgi:hypothetical protein
MGVEETAVADQRASLLRAAVGFALVPPTEPELRLLHRWLDSWRGVGDIAVGMHRQGWDLQPTEPTPPPPRRPRVRPPATGRSRSSISAAWTSSGSARPQTAGGDTLLGQPLDGEGTELRVLRADLPSFLELR